VGQATGSAWKLPPEITSPDSGNAEGKTSGLSVAEPVSISTVARANAKAPRTAPWTCGMQRRL